MVSDVSRSDEELVTRSRGARDVVIFADVSEVWFDLEFLMYGQVRTKGLRLVELSGGTYYVSGHVEDAVGLLNAVLRRCSEPLVAEARSALREGEVLTFGKVLIDREGIFAGVSSGAVIHVAYRLAAELDQGVVVAVLADGGWKYLSGDFWEAADAEAAMERGHWW